MRQKKHVFVVSLLLFSLGIFFFQGCSKTPASPNQILSSSSCPQGKSSSCLSYINISINDQDSITVAQSFAYVVTLEKSADVQIDSSSLEVLSGSCVAKDTWPLPLSSWKLNGKDLQLGLNNWTYTASDRADMHGCQWLAKVKGHIVATGKAVESGVYINTVNGSALTNFCSAPAPCTNGVQCTLSIGSPTSMGQAWVANAANCGFVCKPGYSGPTCQTTAIPNSCSASVPCTNGVQCTLTTGSPTSVEQAWVANAANCGFTCKPGYSGLTCQTTSIANYCSVSRPCTSGIQCTFTIGSPTSLGQAWVKDASSCGFACKPGYTGVDCRTPPPNTCSASPPCTDGVNCTLTSGTPTSIGQAWVKDAANCGFACKPNYIGAVCQTPFEPFYCATTHPCTDGVQCTLTTGSPTSHGQAWVANAVSCGFVCKPEYSGTDCQTQTVITVSGSNPTCPADRTATEYNWVANYCSQDTDCTTASGWSSAAPVCTFRADVRYHPDRTCTAYQWTDVKCSVN